jgi:hypothetical protein
MLICLFLGLKALRVIRYFVWLDFSFDLSGAKIGNNSIQAKENVYFFELQRCNAQR